MAAGFDGWRTAKTNTLSLNTSFYRATDYVIVGYDIICPVLLLILPSFHLQGLYPESNGLIDNNMYDPVFDASFSLSTSEKDNPAWYLGQPVSVFSYHWQLKAKTENARKS